MRNRWLDREKEIPEETQFSDEEMKVIIEGADKKEKRVSVHAQGLNRTKKAVLLGVKLIEHGVYLDEDLCE